jgi:hypothetical protein
VLAGAAITARNILIINRCKYGATWQVGKVCKKCVADHKQKSDENSPVVPTIIWDGSVGTAHNCFQRDTGC